MSDPEAPLPNQSAPTAMSSAVADVMRAAATAKTAVEASGFVQQAQDAARVAAGVADQVQKYRAAVAASTRAAVDVAAAVEQAAAAANWTIDAVTPQWNAFFSQIRQWRRHAWPANWNGLDVDLAVVETICLREGIPLVWVPGPETVTALANAPGPAARRRIIRQRHRGIITDCLAALETASFPGLAAEHTLAVEAAAAVRAGYGAAGQALAANIMETLVTNWVDPSAHDLLKRRKHHKDTQLDLDDFEYQAGLVLAPVWCAYMHYYANQGDIVPRQFARNATVHSGSPRQYTQPNAVIAVMVAVSLLVFLDRHLTGSSAGP
jgi:hypothetical protein